MKVLTILLLTPIAACGGDILISDIQGSEDSSPMVGQTVSISGVVTGDFQDNDRSSRLGGFYVQQESPDSDSMTSNGIFVYDGSSEVTDVSVGDRVEINGTVKEYYGETQIAASQVRVTGSGLIAPTDIDLPANAVAKNSDGDDIADLERYEGMLVRFPQKLSVTNLRFLERFGEVGLSQGGRLYTFTNSNAPNVAGYATHQKTNAARSIVLDDGMRSFGPAVIRYLGAGVTADYSIRTGDSITGLTGNLRYSRGSGGSGDETWRLVPTENTLFDNDNPRPISPAVAGSIRVAALNVLNFFSNIDFGKPVCGPQGDDRCRGADSAQELSRQLAKTVSALVLMDADIVGLTELENNADESIAAIVDALNDRIGSIDYAYLDTGSIHNGAIKTGFIYRTPAIRLSGPFALLDSSVDPRFSDRRNRPALAQSFAVVETGAVFTVIINHLKSKGSSCDRSGDIDRDDGQGNCNITRTNAAVAIADWIKTDPTGSDDTDFLIIGDLNATMREDPLTAFKTAGLANLLEANPDPYSFVFDGQAGALDHALASPGMATQVRDAIEWHINSDEPALLDYNLENGRDPGLFDPDTPYRASDHDPVIIGLDPTN